MFWFPRLDVAGKRPVWLPCIVSLTLWFFMYTSFIFLDLGGCFLIDLFWLIWALKGWLLHSGKFLILQLFCLLSLLFYLCWSYALTLFLHVTFYFFIWFREVFPDCCCCKSWPGNKISHSNCIYPCIFDWVTSCRMKVSVGCAIK